MSEVARRSRLTVAALGLVAGGLTQMPTPLLAREASQTVPVVTCRSATALVRLPGLNEASGIATSRRVPGRLWTLNDSGKPIITALDQRGAITGRVAIAGATVTDWEAIAVGPCGGGAGSCVFIGDIGDNNARRRQITVYRVPEPAADATTATAEPLHATYPDGPRDAETLLIGPDGRLFVVTKGRGQTPVSLYVFPKDLTPGAPVRLERVGPPRAVGRLPSAEMITDGAISPDGKRVVLRSNRTLQFYDASELLSGTWRETQRIGLQSIREPQGEGVTFGAEDRLFVIGESGGGRRGGTFGALTCALK